MDRKKLFENASELLEPEVVKIEGEGKLPSYVNGVLLKNGPGKFDLSDTFTMNNFLDGYAIISRFEITDNSTVSLTKKYLDSEAHRKAMNAGKPCILEFCTKSYADPEKSILFRHLPDVMPSFSDNGNTGIYKIGKHVFTCAETCMFQHIDTKALSIQNRYDTNALFSLGLTSTHPLTDPDTGIVYNFGPSMMTGLKYHMVKINPEGSTNPDEVLSNSKTMGSVGSSSFTKFGYLHSFGMTENFIVMVEQPYQISIPKIIGAAVRQGQRILDFNTWDKKFKNKFVLLNKENGKTVSSVDIRAESPFFYYHFINCYNIGDTHVVVDIVGHPDDGVVESLMISTLRSGSENPDCMSKALRFVFPVLKSLSGIMEGEDLNSDIKTTATAFRKGKSIILKPEFLSKDGIEFPTWNQRYNGKPYKYFYGTGFINSIGNYPHSISKFDTITKETKIYSDPGTYFSEPNFIPNPDGKEEDDGVLMVTGSKAGNGLDYLVFLDGKTMKEIGKAKFSVPIPLSWHGVFIPEE